MPDWRRTRRPAGEGGVPDPGEGRVVADGWIESDRFTLMMLHHDKDFELIAGITGQPGVESLRPG